MKNELSIAKTEASIGAGRESNAMRAVIFAWFVTLSMVLIVVVLIV